MNYFEELKQQIDTFQATREHIVGVAKPPEIESDISHGQAPFAIDDGKHYYAVVEESGEVKPLPFGYQLPEEYIDLDDTDAVLSTPISVPGVGLSCARYVPLVEDYAVPGERAFCLESAEDSSAWEAIGQVVTQVQQLINDKALINFNQRLSNALVQIYSQCEELDSLDQSIAALFMDPSTLLVFLARSYEYALENLHEEIDDEADED